ncbi:hypothetical protein [Streptomyces virginiae]|uniref:hypothetical protein n=1 Tax=Streptomyces virginiae TaxID=1961 RepID=UPI002DBDF147|nr:hypothetical protein [Streptomyces sp. CMAA1738]MEC4570959.1 hypothetical protein [Streptomyces sp. CMAA1738]
MTHTARTRRLALFAATTAVAAGALLVPTTSFAATPATPHAVVADGDGRIKADPQEGRPGTGHHDTWKKDGARGGKRPGKGGSDGGAHVPKEPKWQCVKAPCGPPDRPGKGPDHGPYVPKDPKWQCVTAPCGPPDSSTGSSRPHQH